MALYTTKIEFKKLRIGRREQLIMLEIGKDLINTASSFVDYMQETYGLSKSSVWYCLNKLKEGGIAVFANKQEQGKPLCLTKQGLSELSKIEPSRNEIVEKFINSFLERLQGHPKEERPRQRYMGSESYTL